MRLFTKLGLTSFIGCFLSLGIQAQETVSDECKKNASLGIESAKAKDYQKAKPYLETVRKNCPQYSLATYQYSERILRDELKRAPEANKKSIAENIISLLEERKTHFSSKTPIGDYKSDIAQLMTDYNMGTTQERYELFATAYKDKKNFKGPKKIYSIFSHLIDLQKSGNKTVNDVFTLYDDLMDKIAFEENRMGAKISKYSTKEENGVSLLSKEKKSLSKAENNLKVYNQVKNSMNAKLGKLANCDYLIPLFEGEFNTKKNDINWIKNASKRLYKKKCTDTPIFTSLVTQQHELAPSASTAKYLAKLAEQRKDLGLAAKYYDQAIELETDPNEKADAYFQRAMSFKAKGSYGKAKNYFKKALEFKPSFGAAYLQIANMIGKSANSCGTDEFNKRAVYWLAAKYSKRAGKVDLSVAKNAQKTTASYLSSAPSKSDIFTKGMQGKTVSVGCWINESVKVPSL